MLIKMFIRPPVTMQKVRKNGTDVVMAPMRKAKPFVTDVIVMDGPTSDRVRAHMQSPVVDTPCRSHECMIRNASSTPVCNGGVIGLNS